METLNTTEDKMNMTTIWLNKKSDGILIIFGEGTGKVEAVQYAVRECLFNKVMSINEISITNNKEKNVQHFIYHREIDNGNPFVNNESYIRETDTIL